MVYSYALGMAPVIELINRRPERVLAIFVHPDYRAESDANIFDVCKERRLPVEVNQKLFNIAAGKENIYVIGVFAKIWAPLSPSCSHAVFVNPGDAGNLGTNLRTCLGYDFLDAAIVRPGADAFSPKAVRASMGAAFHMNLSSFSSFDDYNSAFPDHVKFFFSPHGQGDIENIAIPENDKFSLVFGNEATGLPDGLVRDGRGVRIHHSGAIDSLNLSVAVGVAANAFYNLRARRGE